MTLTAKETILLTLAERRDNLARSIEFNEKHVNPPLPNEHLHEQVAALQDAIAECESEWNVRLVKCEEATAGGDYFPGSDAFR